MDNTLTDAEVAAMIRTHIGEPLDKDDKNVVRGWAGTASAIRAAYAKGRASVDKTQIDYSIALQRCIERWVRTGEIPLDIAKEAPHHAAMLQSVDLESVKREAAREALVMLASSMHPHSVLHSGGVMEYANAKYHAPKPAVEEPRGRSTGCRRSGQDRRRNK